MNKVEQLIIEAIQQSLSALDRIDVAALQGRCTPFADERCRLDNLPTLLRHCKRYYEASLRNDTEQVMQSRRDINVYTHTMGFTPEGNDSLLKLLSGEGEKIPSPPSPPPPPPPPPSPLPPINPGGGGHLPPQKSKISPFVLGLIAIAVCFVLGLVLILNQEPKSAPSSKPEEASIPLPMPVEDSTKENSSNEKFSYGEKEYLDTNARVMCLVYLYKDKETNEEKVYFYRGQVSKGDSIRAFRIEKMLAPLEIENQAKQTTRMGILVQELDRIEGLHKKYTYFYGFEGSEVSSSGKYTETNIVGNSPIPPIPAEYNKNNNMPLSLWEAIQKATK